MSYKTITVDLEAYELLRSRKRPGQSFSAVIKSGLRRGGTGQDLLAVLRREALAEETLEALEKVVAARVVSPARPVPL
jgi:predicted CopG family antitoxin